MPQNYEHLPENNYFVKINQRFSGDVALLPLMTGIPIGSGGRRDQIAITFYVDDVQLSDEFLVIAGLSEEAIIGAATIQKWRIKLDFEHDKVIVDPKVAKLQLV